MTHAAAPARRLLLVLTALVLGACAGTAPREPEGLGPTAARALIARALPSHVQRDRDGWTADIYAAFGSIGLPVTAESACAVIAGIDQESTFQVDPQVPGLPMKTFGYSIVYLMGIFTLLLVDHYLGAILELFGS